MAYRTIRDPQPPHKIFCRADPERLLLEFQKDRITTVIDLTQYGFTLPTAQHMPAKAPKPAAQDEQQTAA